MTMTMTTTKTVAVIVDDGQDERETRKPATFLYSHSL